MYREEKERGNVGPLLGEAPLDVSFAPLHPVVRNDDANPIEATAAAEKPNPDGHLDSHNSFHGPEPCMNGCGGQLSDLQMLSSQSNEDSGDRMDGHGGHSLHLRQSSQSKQASPKLPNASLSPKGMIKKKLELMELDLDSVISDPATNPSKWFVETMRKDPSCEQSFSDLYDSLMLKLLHELGREVNMRFKPQQKLESLDCVNGLQSSNPAATDNISGASRRTSELEKICNSLLSKLPKTDVDPDGRSEPKQKSALLNVDHQSPIPNQVTQPAEGPIQTITLDLSFFHNLAFETRQKSSGSSLTHKLDEHIDRHILDEDLHGRRSDEHIDRHRSDEDVEKRSEPQGKPELFNVGASSPIPHQVTRPAGSANQTVTLDLSFFHNLRRTTCEKPVKSSLGRQIIPRGILHVKEKSTSCDEVIQRCNESLCSQSSLRSLESKACQAFQPICFDEFFMGGCWKTACRAEHYNLPVTTKWVWDVVWEGTIYLIRKATKPRIDVLRLLLQFIFDHSPVCALALAKFIPIMKQTEILEFAHCLVTKLSGFFGGEDDTVKLVLLMIYSDVPSELLFNMLLEHFKIFEKKCTFYLELLHFLNYRCHVLAFGLVEKLIENVMFSESDELIHVVAAFLDRLPSYEKAKIDSTSLSCFMLKAKELKINIGGRVESSISSSIAETLDPISSDRCKKGRVSFAEQPRIARIDDQSHSVIREDPIPAPHQLEIQQPDSAFLDNCIEMDFHPLEAHEINPIVVDPSPFDYCIKSVVAVMKSICLEWILYGICNIGEVCDKMHCFFEDHFASVSEEELIIACEFLVDACVTPSLEVLALFLHALFSTKKPEKLLMFKRCASKLKATDSVRLTRLVLKLLSYFMEEWVAVGMVLSTNLTDLSNKTTETFTFDKNLLSDLMSLAINKKSHLPRFVFDEMLRRVSLISENERASIAGTFHSFVDKFMVRRGRSTLIGIDEFSLDSLMEDTFPARFTLELHKGSRKKYLKIGLMMKYAAERGFLINRALDELYPFLLTKPERAHVLTSIMEVCLHFEVYLRKYIYGALGNIGIGIIVRLFEDANKAAAAEILAVFRKFKVDLFSQETTYADISLHRKALVFCELYLEIDGKSDLAVAMFLNLCYLEETGIINASVLDHLKALTEKLFRKLISDFQWENASVLFLGIYSKQISLVNPLNVLQFYESTVRLSFSSPWNRKATLTGLKLFLTIENSGQQVVLQEATCRSLLLTAVEESYVHHHKSGTPGFPDFLSPLIKKCLTRCVRAGAYPQFQSGYQMTLNSSMSEEELHVYLFWRIYYLLKAMKRASVDQFFAIKIKIVKHCTIDNLPEPAHYKIRKVNPSVNECINRLSKVLNRCSLFSLSTFPIKFTTLERGVLELNASCVRQLCSIVMRNLHVHRAMTPMLQTCCSLCLESIPVCFEL